MEYVSNYINQFEFIDNDEECKYLFILYDSCFEIKQYFCYSKQTKQHLGCMTYYFCRGESIDRLKPWISNKALNYFNRILKNIVFA